MDLEAILQKLSAANVFSILDEPCIMCVLEMRRVTVKAIAGMFVDSVKVKESFRKIFLSMIKHR